MASIRATTATTISLGSANGSAHQGVRLAGWIGVGAGVGVGDALAGPLGVASVWLGVCGVCAVGSVGSDGSDGTPLGRLGNRPLGLTGATELGGATLLVDGVTGTEAGVMVDGDGVCELGSLGAMLAGWLGVGLDTVVGGRLVWGAAVGPNGPAVGWLLMVGC
jgi:hypothetical protein